MSRRLTGPLLVVPVLFVVAVLHLLVLSLGVLVVLGCEGAFDDAAAGGRAKDGRSEDAAGLTQEPGCFSPGLRVAATGRLCVRRFSASCAQFWYT